MEIKGDDQLSGAQQWMTKSLTEEKTVKSFSKVSGKGRSAGRPPWEFPKQNLTPHLIVTVPAPLANTFLLVLECIPSLPGTAPTFQNFAAQCLYLDGSLVTEIGWLQQFPILQLRRSQHVWVLPGWTESVAALDPFPTVLPLSPFS